MKVFFSPSTKSFYPDEYRSSYEESGSWPEDAVELLEKEISDFFRATPPNGKAISSKNGRPQWASIAINPLTPDEIDAMRRAAYREEADPLKLEAEYDSIIYGEKADLSKWLAKVAEIKQRLPKQESEND